jgi:hypothetical protein
MNTKKFGYGRLKCSFSQVEGNFNLKEILKLIPIPKRRVTKKRRKRLYLQWKKMRKMSGLEKNWANGDILRLIIWRNVT